jgi:hypothetical protein
MYLCQRLDKLRWQLVLTFVLLKFTRGMSESCDCHKKTWIWIRTRSQQWRRSWTKSVLFTVMTYQFDISKPSHFACSSFDHKVVSTMPLAAGVYRCGPGKFAH